VLRVVLPLALAALTVDTLFWYLLRSMLLLMFVFC